MKNLKNIILNNIEEQIILIKKELNDLESHIKLDKHSYNIQKFLDDYKKGDFNVELLNTFYNDLPIEKIDIKQTYETLEELRKLNNDFYEPQIKICTKQIDNIVNNILTILSKMIKNHGKISYNFKEKTKELNIYLAVKNIIKNNEEIIANEDIINTIFSIVEKIETDNEIKEEFFKQFTIEQSQLINKTINKEKDEVIKKRRSKKRNSNNKIINTEKIDTKNIENEKNKETTISNINNEETNQIILFAKNISEQATTNNTIVLTALDTINENYSFEERNLIYSSIEDAINRKVLILLDVKRNILPKLEEKNDKETFILLKNVINLYNETNKIIQNNEKKDIYEKMIDLKLNNEIKLCEEIKETIHYLKKLLFDNFNNIEKKDYEELYSLYEILDSQYKDYLELIQQYYQGTKDNNDEVYIKEEFERLKNTHIKVNQIIQRIQNYQEDNSIENSEKFYGENPKNIYIFLDDENSNTYIENDIENNKKYLKNDFENLLKTLKTNVNNDYTYKENEADHKAKSDYFTKEFLKTYKVKTMKAGSKRISYSKFSTTISNELDEYPNNPNIIFIYSYFRGDVDSNKKYDDEQEALKRCLKHKKEINDLIDLFNTDWKKLEDTEKKLIANKIRQIIKVNYEKLEKIIKKSKSTTLGGE